MSNFATNMPTLERQLVGKVAFKRNMSSSAFVRWAYLVGLAAIDPEAAKQIIQIRAAKKGMEVDPEAALAEIRTQLRGIALLAVTGVIVWLSMSPGHDEPLFVRAARGGRRRDEITLTREA
jgi:hypothetical protein